MKLLFGKRKRLVLFVSVLFALLAMGPLTGQLHTTKAAAGEVVMLDTTDVGWANGALASSFVLAGKTVVYKTEAQWTAMTTADFGAYDAVVLGDPSCVYNDSPIAVAKANAAVWGAAVDGNVIITGTDEQFHSNVSQNYMDKAAAFVVADASKTGAWISLSCYYEPAAQALPWLDAAFGEAGDFSVSPTDCLDNVHLVATHPALVGLTDADMAPWGCSVHERFESWSPTFEVLAIDLNGAAAYTAPDGSQGTPYVLARGVKVISDIDLTPEDATNPVGTTHTVTATVTVDDPTPGTPVVGTLVTFTVISGPNTGDNDTDTTDANGDASFTYTGDGGVGTDIIEATFVGEDGNTQRSNRVTKEWVDAGPGGGGEGCTPGFWGNHTGAWDGFSTGDDYSDTFGVSASFDATLLEAVGNGGGGEIALGRHAVAALLNASSPDVSYDLSVSDVIALVQDAYSSGDFEAAKNTLESLNEQGCPINGKPDGEKGKPQGSGGKGKGG